LRIVNIYNIFLQRVFGNGRIPDRISEWKDRFVCTWLINMMISWYHDDIMKWVAEFNCSVPCWNNRRIGISLVISGFTTKNISKRNIWCRKPQSSNKGCCRIQNPEPSNLNWYKHAQIVKNDKYINRLNPASCFYIQIYLLSLKICLGAPPHSIVPVSKTGMIWLDRKTNLF